MSVCTFTAGRQCNSDENPREHTATTWQTANYQIKHIVEHNVFFRFYGGDKNAVRAPISVWNGTMWQVLDYIWWYTFNSLIFIVFISFCLVISSIVLRCGCAFTHKNRFHVIRIRCSCLNSVFFFRFAVGERFNRLSSLHLFDTVDWQVNNHIFLGSFFRFHLKFLLAQKLVRQTLMYVFDSWIVLIAKASNRWGNLCNKWNSLKLSVQAAYFQIEHAGRFMVILMRQFKYTYLAIIAIK